jgi:hypothetical protein
MDGLTVIRSAPIRDDLDWKNAKGQPDSVTQVAKKSQEVNKPFQFFPRQAGWPYYINQNSGSGNNWRAQV